MNKDLRQALSWQATGLHADRPSRGQSRTDGDGSLDDPAASEPVRQLDDFALPAPSLPWSHFWSHSPTFRGVRRVPTRVAY